MCENILLRFLRDENLGSCVSFFADVNKDGKVQTARSVQCTPDAFMALVTSHGNVIVLKAGVEVYAIEVRFSNQSERSCCTFDQSQA